jgi:hypothetical protein
MENEQSLEIWKDIAGYNGLYQISNFGRVKSVKRDRILCHNINCNGYCQVWVGKERYTVHRLVAWHFLKPGRFFQEVHHIDADKKNNHYTNLKWVSKSENISASRKLKRVNSKVSKKVIHVPTGKVYESISHAAEEFGCSMMNISRQLRGLRTNKLGFAYYNAA